MTKSFIIEDEKITRRKALSIVEAQARVFNDLGLPSPDCYDAALEFFSHEKESVFERDPDYVQANPLWTENMNAIIKVASDVSMAAAGRG